ncbi:helix-turn-helix domain-containing protein [Streptomyces sp. NY05-11A]|uniref:helix-turn-helix domain-containing protein n=1 Tax=Streptomyces soliscabiei TaxID=588897 RepID=UPI0029BE47B3|nr:helix-turn-helix domain-containing protein [Streptomyces sp. NY05-11A]MDX2675098.1 helix-turn-helix domain-containing protein [Streptomyces sp. NY05-11A]
MKELAGRLTALDPDAGAAVRVIAYFERLAEHRAGLESLVRGVAVLAGCPARLADAGRRVRLRVETDGHRRDTDQPPDPAWPSAALSPDGAPALWLERAGPPSVVDAVILERAAAAIRVVLDRTRGRAPTARADDPALVETLLDATAPEQVRLHAARRLGLDPATRARVVAPFDGPPRIVNVSARRGLIHPQARPSAPEPAPAPVPARGTAPAHAGSATPAPGPAHLDAGSDDTALPPGRVGVGPAVPVLELPGSWAAARTALRFTADGTPNSPGPRVVYADELGGIGLLAELVVPGADPPPDVRALEAAVADAPWMLTTLHAVASTASLRGAAVEVNVHHSTLQDRLGHAETLLGWPVRTPQGRLRLALAMRHLGLA